MMGMHHTTVQRLLDKHEIRPLGKGWVERKNCFCVLYPICAVRILYEKELKNQPLAPDDP